MKTIAALLMMMTSVAGAQDYINLCDPSSKCRATLPSITSNPLPAGAAPVGQPYTLVLRDKRGVTMLIRGKSRESSVAAMTVCNAVADNLRESEDIESAECFK